MGKLTAAFEPVATDVAQEAATPAVEAPLGIDVMLNKFLFPFLNSTTTFTVVASHGNYFEL